MLSAFVEISPDLAQALESNSVLITANERLSREYRRAYDLHLQAQGRQAWVTPSIKSLSRYFLDQYTALRQANPDHHPPVLHRSQMLSFALELEPEAPRHLVQNFVSAFETCRGYQIPPSAIKAHHATGSFYYDWSERFLAATENFIYQQDIPDVLKASGWQPPVALATVLIEELNTNEHAYFDWACQQTSISRVDATGVLRSARQSSDLKDEPNTSAIKINQAYSTPTSGL